MPHTRAWAVATLLLAPLTVLAGPPGTGRLSAGSGDRVQDAAPLAWPTARDAQRLREAGLRERDITSATRVLPQARGACPAGQSAIELVFQTDDFGTETTWLVEARDGTDIATGGVYPSNSSITEQVCVDPAGCYDVLIFDAFGDGIIPPGFAEVYYEGRLIDRVDIFGSIVQIPHLGAGCPPLDPLVDCPPGAIGETHRVHGPGEFWFAGISEAVAQGAPFIRAERFGGLDGPICGLRWWGLYAVLFFDYEPCFEFTPEFDIVVYEDAGGIPGAPVCSYSVDAPGTPTGINYSFFELFTFDVDLPSCCNVRDGWISVQGRGDEFCWHLWLSTPYQDGSHFVWNDDQAHFDPGDLSYCLTGTTTPGACCNPFDATCADAVEPGACVPGNQFTPGTLCAELDPVCGGVPGACCDDRTASCTDNVLPANCSGRHTPGVLCAELDPVCGEAPGPCCYPDGRDCALVSFPECTATGGDWAGIHADCAVCPCIVACPSGAVPEQDACGDDTNYGCNGDPPSFQDIHVGDTICGTGSATGDRDTDWYRFSIDRPSVITVSFEGEFGDRVIFGGLMDYVLEGVGSGDCADIYGGVAPVFNTTACLPADAVSACLPAGTYFAFVSPVDFEEFPCGADNTYHVTVTAEPCEIPLGACCARDGSCRETTLYDCAAAGEVYSGDDSTCALTACRQPQPGDSCALPQRVMLPAELPFLDSNGTCGRFDDHDQTCLGDYDDGEDLVYELLVTEPIAVQITADPHFTSFTSLVLDDACPPASCRWSDLTQGFRVMDLGCRTLEPGTYYVMVDNWPDPPCYFGDLEFSMTACTPAVGACCSASLNCLGTSTEEGCLALGGASWYPQTACDTFACPPPPADSCTDATRITALPLTQPRVDVAGLLDDENVDPSCDSVFSCDVGPARHGWWYTLTPKADCSLEVAVNGMDSAISLWTGPDCAGLAEVDCSDPESTTLPLTGGTRYWVLISNWSCFVDPEEPATVVFGGTCTFVCGDLAPAGGDGAVDAADYQAFMASFGRCTGADAFNPAADLDGDGCVTWVDYQAWLTCYREANAAPTGGTVAPGRRALPTRTSPAQPVLHERPSRGDATAVENASG